MLLLMMDAHSKWMEVHVTNSATSTATIELLRRTFATLGLPEVMVSDNGTAFTSSEFAEFVKRETEFVMFEHLPTIPRRTASWKEPCKHLREVSSVLAKVQSTHVFQDFSSRTE